MKIADLRINNLVKCKVSNDAGIYKVLMLDGYNLKVMLNGSRQNEWYYIDKIKPIKLTSEILEKAGLVEKEKPYSILCTHFIIMGNGGTLRKKCARWIAENLQGQEIETPFLRIDGVADLYFVHELQNLVLDLTKQELQIQL